MIYNMSLQVIPLDVTDSYKRIDEVIQIIQGSGLTYEVCPFSTSIEGEFQELVEILEQAKECCFRNGVEELILNVQFHMRSGKDTRMKEKTQKYA